MKIIVPLAEGFEEIEAVTIVDVLRRAGVEVATGFLTQNPVRGSHGISVTADISLAGVQDAGFDSIVLPGGMPGSDNLKKDVRVLDLIKKYHAAGGITAAVCAAPIVLAAAGIMSGKKAVCYPGFEKFMNGAQIVNEPVVADGNIITGQGPGCALPFALKIVEAITGKQNAVMLKESMQVYWY